jgi:DNA-binding FrmR family transcriptional regulator
MTPTTPSIEPAVVHPNHADGCLHLDPETRANAALRLKSVRGHVEGVQRMLEDEGVYCVDVLKQVSAIQGALRKISDSVLRAHMRDHVSTAALRGDTDHLVEELMEALKYRL